MSPAYRTFSGAKAWKERQPPETFKGRGRARLYAVNDFGTVLTRAIPSRMLKNPRRSGMAYNIGALRRAMRANMPSTASSGTSASRSRKTKVASPYTKTGKLKKGYEPGPEGVEFGPGIPSVIKHHKHHRAGIKGHKTRASKKRKRSLAAKKGWATRRGAARRSTGRAATKRGGAKKARKTRRGSARRSSRFFHGRRVRLTGREYIDKYLTRGLMPTVARVGRMPLSRSGRPAIFSYPISTRIGRLSTKRRTTRGGAKRGYAIGATYRGRRKRRMTAMAANRRRTRRSSRRRNSRRGSRRRVTRNQRYVVMNKRKGSRKGSRRKGSRRKGSRRKGSRRGGLIRNMLAVSKVRWRGRGTSRVGGPKGRYYQMVEFGPKSGKKFRHAGYPVLVPAHVSTHAYVRKFRFGGAAKDRHLAAKSGGYKERRRYSRWRTPPAWYTRKQSKKMTANRRRSRRASMRRNQKYVVMNKRHRRRHMRRNPFSAVLGGADLMNDVVTPVIGGTVGFIAARLLSNGAANIAQVREMLDRGATDGAGAINTKIAANLLGIAATLGLSTRVGIIRQNRGALVTGMGLALTDRLIQRFSAGSPYAGYLGEYVTQPLGEYVSQPMNGLGTMYATAGMGEYVSQPMNGMGAYYAAAGMGEYVEGPDPANQASVDGTMDVAEAAAGVAFEAAAGLGATVMGSGEADAELAAMYAATQPPWVSTEMPVSGALPITKQFPLDREVRGSLVTPEGKGYAGGVFARHLFAGML
jgi:hypothetical protein